MKKLLLILFMLVLAMPVFASSNNSTMTKYERQQARREAINPTHVDVKIGTFQNEVSRAFGWPEEVTMDTQGREIWSYRNRALNIISQSENFISVKPGIPKADKVSRSMQQRFDIAVIFDHDKKVESFRCIPTK